MLSVLTQIYSVDLQLPLIAEFFVLESCQYSQCI